MDALRIYLGIALVVKGVYFIMNMAELESKLGTDLGEVQNLIAWAVVFAHVVGGASLALGFVTRVSAAAECDDSGRCGGNCPAECRRCRCPVLANVDFQFTSFVFFCLLLACMARSRAAFTGPSDAQRRGKRTGSHMTRMIQNLPHRTLRELDCYGTHTRTLGR